jgi:renalase
MRVGIIGAGLAGLTVARILDDCGHSVRLFDKGRAVGGRLATKRLDVNGHTLRLDHGAQYLRPRDPGFAALLLAHGAAPWPDAERFVPVPAFSALPRAMAEGLDCLTGCTIAAMAREAEGWLLDDGAHRHGPFDAVVLTAPAPQSAALLRAPAPELAAMLGGVAYAPCWTWLAAFDAPLPHPDVLRPASGPIGWAARHNARPGRDATEAWVVQATATWSRAHLDETPGSIADLLHAALRALAHDALGTPPPLAEATHRWRYALAETPLGRDCVWDAGRGIGLAGDFCLGARAEAAYLSGRALAEAMLR